MTLAKRYLALLRKSLLNDLYIENEARILYLASRIYFGNATFDAQLVREFLEVRTLPLYAAVDDQKEWGGIAALMVGQGDKVDEVREFRNVSMLAHSMIGRRRMAHLEEVMTAVVNEGIPGDFIETGVWRGGATIFMRGFLAAHDIKDRIVWVADSFEGLPKPHGEQDQGQDYSASTFPYLAVSLDEVRQLFARYDLLDEQVRFLKGWFADTLPSAPIERIALLRLDGDLYSSTMDSLRALYERVAPGGFIVVDDYHTFPGCKEAVAEFLTDKTPATPLLAIDRSSVYWRK